MDTLPLSATDNGDGTATLQVDAELTATIDPTGLATSAKQDTGNSILSSIDGKLLAKGSEIAVSGKKYVSTAGTAVAIGSDLDTRNLIITANIGNSGNIYLGPSTVDSSTGITLPAGAVIPCGNVNLSEIYIDSDNNGEGISYYCTV